MQLVNSHKNVLENKKTDAVTTKRKQEEWIRLAQEFNANSPGISRTAMILKRKFENMKKNMKKSYAREKKYTMGTGGGSAMPVYIDDAEASLADILGERLVGYPTKYDDDSNIGKWLFSCGLYHYRFK